MFASNNDYLLEIDELSMKEMKQSLSNLQASKQYISNKRDILGQMQEAQKNFDFGKDLYEEFDVIAFQTKVKLDGLYFEQLLQKLDDQYTDPVQNAFESLYKDIYNIYEHVNIRPGVYGNNINEETINESMETIQQQMSKNIYEYLDRNFYNLDVKARETKYLEESTEISKDLITEGVSPEEAIPYSVKVIVMENLLRHITFPFSVWSRVNYLCEDQNYGLIFDQDKLIDLRESYERKLHNIAKIVATCV